MDPRIKRWEWREANPIRPRRYASEVPAANQHTTADILAAPQRWWPVGSLECRRGMWNGAHVTCQNRPPAPAQTQTQSRRSDRRAGSVDRPADVAPGYCTVCKLSVVTQGFAVRWQRYLHRRVQVSGGLPRHTALKRNFAYTRRIEPFTG